MKLSIEITPTGISNSKYVHLIGHIANDTVTYLPVGNVPAKSYALAIQGAEADIFRYWPNSICGINPQGTLFSSATRKMIPAGGDVKVGDKCLLLIRGVAANIPKDISSKRICSQRVNYSQWTIYEIRANGLSETAAKFFLDMGYMLSEQVISLTPVWPAYVAAPYVYKYGVSAAVHIYASGDVSAAIYPESSSVRRFRADKGNVLRVTCQSSQQLLSIGHQDQVRVVRYTSLWHECVETVSKAPVVVVHDEQNNEIAPGDYNTLPPKRWLRIEAKYDGSYEMARDGIVISKGTLSATIPTIVNDIVFGLTLSVFCGMDLVWQSTYTRLIETHDNDRVLYDRLLRASGPNVQFPHSYGSVAAKLGHYPLTKQWVYQAVKKGTAPKGAVQILRMFLSKGRV